MSLFSRFTRAIKALFGMAVSSAEDPRAILEQNIRELNDQVPKMNDNIATVKANLKTLESDLEDATARRDKLEKRTKAAIDRDRDDIAKKYAMRLEDAKEEVERLKPQVEQARNALEKAKDVKAAFMREKEKKVDEAKAALREHERAQYQAEIADTMEQFEVDGIDQTHDEMVRKLEEQTAKNQARTEMALDSIDDEEFMIEEEAEEMRAEQLVESLKEDMDETEALPESTTEDAPEVEIDDVEEEETEEVPEKTIGRQRAEA